MVMHSPHQNQNLMNANITNHNVQVHCHYVIRLLMLPCVRANSSPMPEVVSGFHQIT